jgi:alkylation response protein AidB-like acyl-CoA dehydrogenase
MSTTELVMDTRDFEFCLFEWLQVGQLQRFSKYADFDTETLQLLVTEGMKFAMEVIGPTNREADREGCKVVDGHAVVPGCLHSAYQQAYELGWASITASQEFGGQGAPEAIGLALSEGVLGGNLALGMYFGLTQGAMELIESFGDEALKNTYCEKMTTGEYTGTMCLSEPQAGSDVGAAKTAAEPVQGKRYRIKGSKCWISSGDNDLGANVIHLVLARVHGDPAGTRGLSLFVVPKISVNEDGSLGEANDVTLVSLEDKMGIKASATAVLSFGDRDACYGYLLGEQGDGMRMMFQMMNTERISVAGMGLGIASAAYQNALAYARERIQGAHIDSMASGDDAASVPIIQHPDVRYSLTGMKARVEAIRALLYGACFIEDKMHISEDAAEKQELDDFFQILTPMCKGWACETGLDVTRTGMQVLGGVGFTKDFPMEQYYRDLRISAIYEGTTGIQALDLVGRKMTMSKGRLFLNLLRRFGELFEAHKNHPRLGQDFEIWKEAYDKMTICSMTFTEMMKEKGLSGAVLYATPFMHLLAAVTAGYFFLQQGLVAHDKLEELKKESSVDEADLDEFLAENAGARFYENKLITLDFFLNVMLPRYQSYAVPIVNKNYAALDIAL